MDGVAEAKLTAVAGAARALGESDKVEAVYLSGSLLAGLGTPTSDVDLFAVLADQAERPARQLLVRGERVDIEYLDIATLAEALERVAAVDFRRERLTVPLFLESPLDLLVRFSLAEVIKPSPALTRLRERVAAQADHLRRVLLTRYAMQVTQALEDFEGACAQRDWDSAVWLGQQMLTHAGKALAAAAGDLYVNRKWVYRQLARTMPASFPMRSFRFFQQGTWAQASDSPDPAALLNFVQECIAAAQLCGWDQPRVTSWPFSGEGPAAALAGGLRREEYVSFVRTASGVLLHYEKSRQLLLLPDIALVWALAGTGRGAAEIAETARKLGTEVTGLGEVTAERADAILASLASQRVLRGSE